jgi:hypothetical protein
MQVIDMMNNGRGFFDQDFYPADTRVSTPSADQRMATATEYSAHHLGRISRNLERLIAILEKGTTPDSGKL